MRQIVIILALLILLYPFDARTATADQEAAQLPGNLDRENLRNYLQSGQSADGGQPEPRLFRPAYFRPPGPWLKIDDRFEEFVTSAEVQRELFDLERLLSNPLGHLGKELSQGIVYQRDAYGRLVGTVKLGDGRFEFSSSVGRPGWPGRQQDSYDQEGWLESLGDKPPEP